MCCMLITSCAPTYYYQLVNTKPASEGLKKTERAVIYEDDNCIINYNLWANGGTTQISIENKTDEDIYIDLGATFFFINNQAFDIYDGSTKTKSVVNTSGAGIYWGFGISTSTERATKSTVMTQQHQIVTIPAKMYKVIKETDVTVTNTIFRDCNLFLRPSKKEINSSSFSQTNTPYSFGLRIVYYVGSNETPVKVRNEFYVDQITNYPLQSFKEYYTDNGVLCPDEKVKGNRKLKYKFKDVDAFYIEYNPAIIGRSPNGYLYNH